MIKSHSLKQMSSINTGLRHMSLKERLKNAVSEKYIKPNCSPKTK